MYTSALGEHVCPVVARPLLRANARATACCTRSTAAHVRCWPCAQAPELAATFELHHAMANHSTQPSAGIWIRHEHCLTIWHAQLCVQEAQHQAACR